MTDHQTQTQPPSISLLIRTYTEKRLAYLILTLDSIAQQTIQPTELIITVDHNPELMKTLKDRYPAVRIIPNSRGRGSSGSLNTGISAASGDIIVLIDDDAVAEVDWLENLLKHYSRPDVLGVGGFITPKWETARPKWLPEEFFWVVGCSYTGLPAGLAQVRNLIGCNMSIRREVFAKIGGFREGFGHSGGQPSGCEETDVCIRASQNFPGQIFLYEPSATVHHAVPAQRTQFRYFVWRCFLEGRSKALITMFVGAQDGLASESAYVLRVLPRGILRYLGEGFRGDLSGFSRAFAILVGLGSTGLSHVYYRLTLRNHQFEAADLGMPGEALEV